MAHDVFISHSSTDKSTADAICHALEQQNIRCWIAPRDVRGGYDYPAEIMLGIENCKIMVLVFSEESNTSPYVYAEVERAFSEEKTIIPYRLSQVEMSLNLKFFLSGKHWIDAYPDDKVFEKLIISVSNILNMDTKSLTSLKVTLTEPHQEKLKQPLEEVSIHNKSADELYSDGIKLYWEKKQHELAFTYFKKATEQGHKVATTQLGHCYNHGNGVAQDDVEALKWYREGASNGDPNAKVWLANFYKFGRGVPKNQAEAYRWYKEAAEQGHSSGYEGLGYAYAEGLSVDENQEEAEKWFRKAAEKGNKGAKDWLEKNGKADNIFYNGKIHYIEKRYAEAFPLFVKASELNHLEAEYYLGIMFIEELGVSADVREGAKRVKKAAEKGLVEAQYYLGKMYSEGKHISKNTIEAVKWYEKAAEQGHLSSQKELPYYYDYGIGTDKNEEKAFEWKLKAAEQGHVDSYSEMGHRYYYGRGIPIDYKKAFEWYTKAAEHEMISGYNWLGVLYFNGKGPDKNESQAAYWWKKSAERNDAFGCHKMASLHMNGTGIEKDLVKAREYAEKSVALGREKAKLVLEEINAMLTNTTTESETKQAITTVTKDDNHNSQNHNTQKNDDEEILKGSMKMEGQTFVLNDEFLKEVGLGALPPEQKQAFLQHIYGELKMRVGYKLTEDMSDEQIEEFGDFIDQGFDQMSKWFKDNLPDYKEHADYQQLLAANPKMPEEAIMAEYGAIKWLHLHRPDYPKIVAETLRELKKEIISNKTAILEEEDSVDCRQNDH